jgi:DNA-binding PadR family transcriptional regulator
MSYIMRTIVIHHFGLWELAVLALLRERPMHPYQMQLLLRERRKDELLALKRGSLYHAIGRLERAGFITAIKTGRAGRRPERTIYRLTATGGSELTRWLREMVAVPKRESSEFMACMSFLLHLDPHDAVGQLEQRAKRLKTEIQELRSLLKSVVARVGRINVLESEYLITMRKAELDWVRGIVKDIRSSSLVWDFTQLVKQVWAAKSPSRVEHKP